MYSPKSFKDLSMKKCSVKKMYQNFPNSFKLFRFANRCCQSLMLGKGIYQNRKPEFSRNMLSYQRNTENLKKILKYK